MKTDPERMAWTCARCGTLALTPLGEQPWARDERPVAAETGAAYGR
jgi:hypothetical protein